MRPPYVTSELLNDFIDRAFQEDLGDGDHSTLASIPADAEKSAYLLMKESGVIAGMDLAPLIFHKLDPNMTIEPLVKDGEEVKKGNIILRLKGKVRAILSGERLLLNCMQRMSGIATKTAYLNTLIKGTSARLLDTRKTTPNMRMLEKWAVIIGGGVNHRYGLYDMVMLKDNHVDFAGGIEKAVHSTQEYLKAKGLKLKIEVETRNLDEVKQALDAGGVDRIMLDNMSNEDMRAAVELIAKRSETEASGGITEKTIRSVAETGVDYISVGALTHSIKSLDISLKAE
ncbi:MAG: carboxylating nicotinate-nucleotide diphosphorylase [Roseivirga sp.]|jgi:nicotinate-nucleotide pyrophosphorylase (carboxylating)|uniref:carboxylating nicotinate-nucleotide diphosphorylase n=1 Tax=Roseivirga sp. TaxID=1964215 RepID=UPI001B1F80E4|nr:carboxylating nicotinate-nucleotide diphosphorylase [Roseivirga sp.]MBO6494194.1 carboxylating nicotinate-nucleotide diphosphorylase [Roseivirga sp.]MBO6661355.1 carboxylating nicotinate-nucleotide diphosphorylase [Roseivirga sp.]MBO6759447.1 carboxylating nicotinate-nucleotide diphosphorylase [Roseivirga sp.]MBO6908661.1 carboxylating nicotinate-nucleotide diphosphorylase [Roseivirga sp.]